VLASTVALGPAIDPDPASMSESRRTSLVRPLVLQANECIALRIVADDRYKGHQTDIGDLIIDALPECVDRIRAMVDGCDRYFGDGSGAEFFADTYLKALPNAVNELIETLEVR
jgi:hypothetical protein